MNREPRRRRRAVSTMMAGILLFAILATIVISLTYIYASGLAGFFNAFQEHQLTPSPP